MSGRKLTHNEIAIAKKVFKDSLDYQKIRIHNEKYAFFQPNNSGMTPNGEIYVHGAYRKDYSSAVPQLKAFFIHEMVHVWQYQLKILNPVTAAIGESIRHVFSYEKAYEYTLEAGKDILDYKIEQQASIIEDYYRVTHAGLPVHLNRMKNNYSDVKKDKLFEKVLAKFITSPKYALHTIECKRSRHGKPGTRKIVCNRVPVNG